MAINTNDQGQVQVFAKAPAIPDNVGKLDVGEIFNRVSQGVNLARGLSDATRAAAGANTDLSTDIQKQAAIRSLIPAQTAAAASTAAGEQATGAATASRGNFLAGLSGPQRIAADQGVIPGQVVHASRIYDTSDPTNPKLVDKEETYIPGKDGNPVLTGTKVSSVYSPRDIQVFREHTDVNGNIVTTDGTYRQLDVSKPAFQIDKEGNIAPILGADGQPVNAALVAATGKAERGTPIGSGVAGDAANISRYEQIMADHPDTVPALQPLVDSLKANIKANTDRTNAGGQPTKGDAGAQLIQRIADVKNDIAEAAVSDDAKVRANVPVLQATLDLYNNRLSALNTGAAKAKAGAPTSLSNYVAPGSPAAQPAPAPAAGGAPAAAPAGSISVTGPSDPTFLSLGPNVTFYMNGQPFTTSPNKVPQTPQPAATGAPAGQ